MAIGKTPPAERPLVDYERPLLPQVIELGEAYDAWVHRSIKPAKSLRIFRSDFFEAMSHIPWWIVPLVWVPVVTLLFLASVKLRGVPSGRAAALAGVGLFSWTLVEYLLHRFVFHYKPHSGWGRALHFLGHGIHHLDPWDPTRLVFPPVAGMLIALPIFGLVWIASLGAADPFGTALAVMAGLLVGYMAYDLIHYYTHHAKPKTRIGRFLKTYHLAHHHKYWNRMFGVSQPLWDIVFRTGRPAA